MATHRKNREVFLIMILSFLLCSAAFLFFGRSAWAQCTSCADCPPPMIHYSSNQMKFNEEQTLSVLGGGGEPYTWSILSGGGTVSSDVGSAVIYKAPSSNPYCSYHPTISVKDACGRTAEISLAVSKPPTSFEMAARHYSDFRGRVLGHCSCGYSWVGISCDGRWGYLFHPCSPGKMEFCPYPPPPGWDFFDYLDYVWTNLCAQSAEACFSDCICIDGYVQDVRTSDQMQNGCCPAQLMGCLDISSFHADSSVLNLSGGQEVHFTGAISPQGAESMEWVFRVGDRVIEGVGDSVLVSWDGKDVLGKQVDPGVYPAKLEVRGSGGSCGSGRSQAVSIPITVTATKEDTCLEK